MDFIKRCLIALLLLFFLWAGLAASEWLPRPTAVQRKALAILNAPPATATDRRNAFAAIWLWQYDIPAADLNALANNDLARYRIPALDAGDTFLC